MPRETTGRWTQKVSHNSLWNTIILDATLVVSDDGHGTSWRGAVSSERYSGPFQVIPELASEAPVRLDVTLPDGLLLTGDVHLRRLGAEWILWTDHLAYHYPDQEHQPITGSLLAFGASNVWPPSPPYPPYPPLPPGPPYPPDDDPVVAPFVRPAHGREGTLFPYQYLRAWPAPPPEEIALGFAAYPPRARVKLPDALIQSLQQLKKAGGSGARVAMEDAVVAYIDAPPVVGPGADDAPFVASVADLPLPLSRYPEARAVIVASKGQPPAVVLERLRAVVGSPDLDETAYLQALTRAWQSLLALAVVSGDDLSLRGALLDVVVVDHLLTWLATREEASVTTADLERLGGASLVLPASVFPLPPAAPQGTATLAPATASEWIVPYAVGDLQLVKQRLVGYALGEIAHVQSVMAGERRTTVQRRKSRLLRTVARTASDDRSSGSGLLSLTGEVRSSIEDAVTTATFKNFSTTYGPPASSSSDDASTDAPTTSINGSWRLERTPTVESESAPRPSEASRYARKVLDRAVQRVANKVVEARVTEALREAEETTTSELDNTSGTTGRRGIFRWLDEIHEAFVVNHGSRLVLEVLLASPGAAYLRDEIDLPRSAVPPVPPAALGVTSYTDVTREVFPRLAALYPGESLSLPPALLRSTSGWARSGEPVSLTLPDGYVSTQISVGQAVTPKQSALAVSGVAGRTTIRMPEAGDSPFTQPLLGERGTVHVLLQTSPVGGSSTAMLPVAETAPADSPVAPVAPAAQLVVEIDAAPDDACMAEWQFRTFQAVQAAHAVQVETHRGTRLGEPAETAPLQRLGARAVEQRELKHGAFELLFQTRSRRVGSDPGGVDVARPRYLQFFERAFEWPEVSYGFLLDTVGGAKARRLTQGDDRFVDFLEASFAQVLLPVSLREALPVLFFLASGVLWSGAGDTAPVHEADVALACALKQLLGAPREPRRVGEPWEVVVPTTAAVLQDGSGTLRDLAAARADVPREKA